MHDPWLFAATVLVVNATPGVDMMLTAARTLRHGVRGGLATALGIEAGCVVHTLAAAFGLAALMAASATAFSVVKWAGAAYLLWLAYSMLRTSLRGPRGGGTARVEAQEPHAAHLRFPVASGAASLAELVRQGLLTNVLNPKIALFFLALLPQFIEADAPHKTLVFLALGAWFVLQSAVFLTALVLLVAPLARWRAPAALERALHALGAAIFVGLAARLALADRH
ncbi:MAG TPA: LysE family translocator [Caldimonas sp.]|nr:LysE family translocator [Caldimonas sp.]